MPDVDEPGFCPLQIISNTMVSTCMYVMLVVMLFISKLFFYLHPTKIHCEILMVAVGTTRTLLIPPRHRQESVPPRDVVLEDCLT